jgi:stage IV sporulation protein FB
VVLLAFNMIPAFPMDGGRVLRAALSSRLGLLRGTQIAARIGQAFAVGLAFLGLQYNPMLLLIAVFVFLGAESEFAMIRNRELGGDLTARRLLVTDVHSLLPETTLDEAIRALTTLDQRAFPVIDPDGGLHGTVTRDDLLHGVARHGLAAPVSLAMQPPAGELVIPIDLPFEATMQRLLASGREALPVVDETGRFAGLITRDNLTDILLMQQLRSRMAGRHQA